MKDLDKSWHDGLDEDGKEWTVKEIFALLMPWQVRVIRSVESNELQEINGI